MISITASAGSIPHRPDVRDQGRERGWRNGDGVYSRGVFGLHAKENEAWQQEKARADTEEAGQY